MQVVVALCGAQAVEDKQQQLETNLLQEVVHEEKHATKCALTTKLVVTRAPLYLKSILKYRAASATVLAELVPDHPPRDARSDAERPTMSAAIGRVPSLTK